MKASYSEFLENERAKALKQLMTFARKYQGGDEYIFSANFIHTQLVGVLGLLGHPDGDIRYNQVWDLLNRYFDDERFPKNERVFVIDLLCNSEFMTANIDKGESLESVKRSFSMLGIAALIWGDKDHGPTLSSEDIERYAAKAICQLQTEQDTRGIDTELGWVHNLAHNADLLTALIAHPKCPDLLPIRVAEAIFQYIENRGSKLFRWDEQRRLATTLELAIERDEDRVLDLMKQLYTTENIYQLESHQNTVNLLRCVLIECILFEEKQVNTVNWLKHLFANS